MISSTLAVSGFNPTPSVDRTAKLSIGVSESSPGDASCWGVPVAQGGPVPSEIGLDVEALRGAGFDGAVGQTLVIPRDRGPTLIAVGIGSNDSLDAATLRDAAAALTRAASRLPHIATTLADVTKLGPDAAAQAVVEGVLLASYRYDTLKSSNDGQGLKALTLVAGREKLDAATRGAERGRTMAGASQLTRDLANTPPAHLNAQRLAEVATAMAAQSGLEIEIFDKEALVKLGCGGLLGVNRGSADPPRLIKLTYRPKDDQGELLPPGGHLALVGKGVMYDSGGINLKPSDDMHAAMKLDMSGAAAVLSAMSKLAGLGCRCTVTGYLMCTDNMPSGTAMKLGDVLTIRGGTTVEVQNTDAEGRLMLADGLVLATEEKPDAIVTIATLTGACMRALGTRMAGVLGNDQALVDRVCRAGERTDEPVWQLPLEKRYRKELDSEVADLKNVGGENAGAITAALFLAEFVGKVPWAHLDICGPMKVDSDDSWRSKGATGFGTRLLVELALNFRGTSGERAATA